MNLTKQEPFCRQYQDFLEDLEEDESLRKNINIFRGEDVNTTFGTLKYIHKLNIYAHYVPVHFQTPQRFL